MVVSTIGISQQQTIVKGKIKKGRNKMIYLQHNEGNKVKYVDSAKINFFGRFQLETDIVLDDFYQITIDKKEFNLLILKGGEEIFVESSTDFKNKDYQVKGSADSKLVQEFYKMKSNKDVSKDSMSKFAMNFIEKNSKSLAVFIALNDVKELKKAIQIAEKGIGESYNNSNYHNSLKSALKQITQTNKAKKNSKTPIGAIAPELNMVNPEGKIITLESLRGKYVLIDFWASWCGPCRRENPTVVRLYNKYKDKGFDVYSVSLDKNKSKWKSAIVKDGLVWENHVSDLKGWGSAATGLYGFRGIPYTVLIDKEGKVIATRLRGAALERKLEQLFK
jgi:thiol-disulfide isomerase/thioredoxin